jgi:hypothetical protein
VDELPRMLAWVAADLEGKGYAYCGLVRQAARRLATSNTAPEPEPDPDRCRRCGTPITQQPTGRTRLYCSDPCRKGRRPPTRTEPGRNRHSQ